MKLNVETPLGFQKERHYILSILLDVFLGLEITIKNSKCKNIIISSSGQNKLIINDNFFSKSINTWLTRESLPVQPLNIWKFNSEKINPKITNNSIPVIYGEKTKNEDFLIINDKAIELGLDIFGSSFFMMTRYEEFVNHERDELNRFSAKSSLAYQENFLHRPIINEYLEILWSCLKYLWPGLKRKKFVFKTYLSHDVDNPFAHAFTTLPKMIKACAGDIIKRSDPLNMLKRPVEWVRVKLGNTTADPNNNFMELLDIVEKHNLKSSFYFITDHTELNRDATYKINHPSIRFIMKQIFNRGHEIGLHGSYNSYNDVTQIKKELKILIQSCNEEGIKQDYWGCRQHYLRYEIPTTFQNLSDAGLNYDVTLTYADCAGFRCGVCYEYKAFNILTSEKLDLIIRPLIVMECTIIDKSYMNLRLETGDAYQKIIQLKRNCQLMNGNFTVLWHNDRIIDKEENLLFENVLSA